MSPIRPLTQLFAYNLRYEARITSTTETSTDTGRAELFPGDFATPVIRGGGFTQNFVSSEGPIAEPPPVPTSQDQCKKDGWRTYGIFKNQGDCVSFVATHGKNEPGKNQPNPKK
jgi:hypothetical protein